MNNTYYNFRDKKRSIFFKSHGFIRKFKSIVVGFFVFFGFMKSL